MKRIINAIRFDTSKAELVYSNTDRRDLFGSQEDLYCTASRTFFLHQHSAKKEGFAGMEELIPMTSKAARQYLEKHNQIDLLEKYFADELVDA